MPSFTGPRLPRILFDQISERGPSKTSQYRGQPSTRKERRKQERAQKPVRTRPDRRIHAIPPDQEGDASSEQEDRSEQQPAIPQPSRIAKESAAKKRKPQDEERSIQKNAKRKKTEEAEKHMQWSPPRKSKKLEQDNDEIADLEKKLGIKDRKKLPKVFADEGLDDFLGDMGDVSDSEADQEEQEWLRRKRRKASVQDIGHSSSGDEDEADQNQSEDAVSFSDEDFEAFDSDSASEHSTDEERAASPHDRKSVTKPEPRKRENPYVPPLQTNSTPIAAYVPPSRRQAPADDNELNRRLKRQAQGLLNRLSDSNLISILDDIGKLYQQHPRQYVTSSLIDILLSLTCARSALTDSFIILHAGFIAALYKVHGPDFGAQMVEALDTRLAAYRTDDPGQDQGRQALNLIALLSQLYNFQVINSNLMFDYIRSFLEEVSEAHTELLLRVIRYCGPQLRQDSPLALKDIVVMLQKKISLIGEQNLSVRTKFMVETIGALKDNRMKQGVAASALISDHTTRMRKTLGSFNNRPNTSFRATEPLAVNLHGVRAPDKKGQWWLPSATTSRLHNLDRPCEPPASSTQPDAADDTDEPLDPSHSIGTPMSLDALARQNGMNTSIRRAIFTTLLTSTDYRDAHNRLTKLDLTHSQKRQIPHVLLHCAGTEKTYNPYYTVIARRLCGSKRMKMGFIFGLWDLFAPMGERKDGEADADEEDGENEGKGGLNVTAVVNHAKMFGNLVAVKALDLSILKTLNLPSLKPLTKTFVEILLITLITQSLKTGPRTSSATPLPPALTTIFSSVNADHPHLSTGLSFFLKTHITNSDLVSSRDRKAVKATCKALRRVLTGVGERETDKA